MTDVLNECRTMSGASAPQNEPAKEYLAGSADRDQLQACLRDMSESCIEITSTINGEQVETGKLRPVIAPHDRSNILAQCHVAGNKELQAAVTAARKAKPGWEALSWHDRAAIFLRAAELLCGPYRNALNAATMLGQSKNAHQAEIDSACELIDFFRFNVYFYGQILQQQPLSVPGVRNWLDYRPLNGFVLAITPFNFTAIAGNLSTAPALLGNTVVWKPADTQVYAASLTMNLLEEAGLPPGVINLVTSGGPETSDALLREKDLAGVHFTGSSATFDGIYEVVGHNIRHYDAYPRLVGETGGKDFVFAHASCDRKALVAGLIRGAFEYQGQKCSAASRAYIPQSIWPEIRERLCDQIAKIQVGDVADFSSFMNAVIDDRAYQKIAGYLAEAANHPDAHILIGGGHDSSVGYFIEPTVIVTQDPRYRSMREEIFGPVLSIYVYDDKRMDDILVECALGTPYALTGAVFSQDRAATVAISARLRSAAVNFYVNDKPSGAVVGQQPFGGSRRSGTNDKAGSPLNLYRWLSPRTVKENLMPPRDYAYPFMA